MRSDITEVRAGVEFVVKLLMQPLMGGTNVKLRGVRYGHIEQCVPSSDDDLFFEKSKIELDWYF